MDGEVVVGGGHKIFLSTYNTPGFTGFGLSLNPTYTLKSKNDNDK